jgi:hypothetical protein
VKSGLAVDTFNLKVCLSKDYRSIDTVLSAHSPFCTMAPQQPVLLVDFAVYKPPEELKIEYFATQKASRKWQVCSREQQCVSTVWPATYAEDGISSKLIQRTLSSWGHSVAAFYTAPAIAVRARLTPPTSQTN